MVGTHLSSQQKVTAVQSAQRLRDHTRLKRSVHLAHSFVCNLDWVATQAEHRCHCRDHSKPHGDTLRFDSKERTETQVPNWFGWMCSTQPRNKDRLAPIGLPGFSS